MAQNDIVELTAWPKIEDCMEVNSPMSVKFCVDNILVTYLQYYCGKHTFIIAINSICYKNSPLANYY